MTMTPDGFSAAFRRHFPDLLGQPVLVALSGGADSVALLCLQHGSREGLGCRVSAAHVHHHVRGAPADADAAFCAELCQRLRIPLVVEHLDPVRPRGSSPEAWWRQERYRVLEGVRQAAGCAALATAHTLDDQAETVLLKLLRGSGPRGVAGVRRRHGAVVRPLLDFRREELRDWLSAQGVGWREDASNADPEQPRAWIRNRVLPLLAGAYPHGMAHLTEFAAALAEDEAFIGGVLRECGVWPEVGRAVPVEPVAALPAPLLRRWILELAARLPLAEPPSRAQLAAVLSMLFGGAPAAVDLGRRWVLRRRGGSLVLSPPPIRPYAAHPAAVPSRVELPGGFVATLGVAGSPRPPHRAVLDRRVAALPLAWRPATPGERFGTSGRSVARALARAGVPAQWRRAWPALEAGGTMVWLPAVGVAHGWEGDDADGVVAGLEEPWGRHVR